MRLIAGRTVQRCQFASKEPNHGLIIKIILIEILIKSILNGIICKISRITKPCLKCSKRSFFSHTKVYILGTVYILRVRKLPQICVASPEQGILQLVDTPYLP